MKDLGLKRGTVELVPHKDSWHQSYAHEATQLKKALHIEPRSLIQHVGSTSVPGILAKPILDIAIRVDSLDIVDTWIKPLEKLGYQYKGFEPDMPQRRFFTKGPEELREVYLHIVNKEEFSKLTAFRDALIADNHLAKEYSELKKKFAITNKNNRSHYTHLKNEFIIKVLNG
jgi:GrpB-like predicted nucleotidyltransferase (UPF0157 family)